MANLYESRDATHGGLVEPTHPWMDQIRRRLVKEFVARTSVAEIATYIEQARSDLVAPSPAALPELVERLARVRLRAHVGLVRQHGEPAGAVH